MDRYWYLVHLLSSLSNFSEGLANKAQKHERSHNGAYDSGRWDSDEIAQAGVRGGSRCWRSGWRLDLCQSRRRLVPGAARHLQYFERFKEDIS